MTEVLTREELLQLPNGYLQELPEVLAELANKMADKGIYVCRSEDSPSYGSDVRAKGSIRFSRRGRTKWRIDYGTGWCSDATCWNEYEEIGDQVIFFLKGKGVDYDWERGRSITVEVER